MTENTDKLVSQISEALQKADVVTKEGWNTLIEGVRVDGYIDLVMFVVFSGLAGFAFTYLNKHYRLYKKNKGDIYNDEALHVLISGFLFGVLALCSYSCLYHGFMDLAYTEYVVLEKILKVK